MNMASKFLNPDDVVRKNELIVMGVYVIISVVPAIALTGVDSQTGNWCLWWPGVLLLMLQSAAMMTDNYDRTPVERVTFIGLSMVLYGIVTLPLSWAIGRFVIHIEELKLGLARHYWAALAATAGFPQLVYGMRASRWMVQWGEWSKARED